MNDLTKIFSKEIEDLSQEQKVNLESLIVPYLDIAEDKNDQTASLKWALLGTYSKKDTAQLQNLFVDYQTNIGPLDTHNLVEILKKAYETNDIEIEVISNSDKESALSDLVVWNGDVETESEALRWLINREYDVSQYKEAIRTLYNEIKNDPQTPAENLEYSEKFKTREDAVIWLVKEAHKAYESELKQAQEEPQQTEEKAPAATEKTDDWDDEHWEHVGTVRLMRSAAVQKSQEIAEYKKSKIKELISDGPIAASMATGSVPAMVLTGLGTTIAVLINKAEKETEKEYLEILESLSRFTENKKDPKKQNEAASILKQDVARLNIKLSGIKPVTKEEFRASYPTLLKRARKEGFLPDPELSAKKIEDTGKSLLHIKDTESIARRFAHSTKNGAVYAWNCLVDSVKEWKDPVALASGTVNGLKATYTNIVDSFHISDFQKTQRASRITVDRVENEIVKINENVQKKLPITELLHTDFDLQDLEASKAAHKNIEEYKQRQPLNHANFGLASSLTLYAGYDLVDKAMELVKIYSHDPQVMQQGQEMLQNAVTDNWIGVLSNSWGILFGGIAALSATGKKLHHDTMALRSEFSKIDKNLSSVVELEKEIRKIHTEQLQKAEKEHAAEPSNE